MSGKEKTAVKETWLPQENTVEKLDQIITKTARNQTSLNKLTMSVGNLKRLYQGRLSEWSVFLKKAEIKMKCYEFLIYSVWQ